MLRWQRWLKRRSSAAAYGASKCETARFSSGESRVVMAAQTDGSLLSSVLSTLRASQATLLFGPSQSGKTTMLLQHAYTIVSTISTGIVLFLAPKSRRANIPNDWMKGNERHDALSRIHFKYLPSDVELRAVLANLHLLDVPCSMLIVDDVFQFFRGGSPRPQVLAQTLALMQDACTHMSEVLKCTDPEHQACTLLLSDTVGGSQAPRQLYILDRWIPLMLTLEGQQVSGATAVEYTIKVLQQDRSTELAG